MLNNIEVYQSVRNMYRHLIVNYSLQIWEMCFYFMLTNKFWYSNTSLYFLNPYSNSVQANYDYLKKLFTILHTIARLLLRVYALAFVHYIVDLRNSNCYCLLTMNRRICCRKNCVVFLQIDIHDHLYLLLFDHSIKTYILCIKTIEMQKFTIALDRNSSVVNFRFVTPLKSKLKTAISGCVSLFPIFYISRSL